MDIIILAYQVISNQRANVFNFMLPALGKSFIVYGKLGEWLVPSADSRNKNFTCDCEERLDLKVNSMKRCIYYQSLVIQVRAFMSVDHQAYCYLYGIKA